MLKWLAKWKWTFLAFFILKGLASTAVLLGIGWQVAPHVQRLGKASQAQRGTPAQTVVEALQAYAIETGRLPDSLAEIMGTKYLPALPLDPATGRPLHVAFHPRAAREHSLLVLALPDQPGATAVAGPGGTPFYAYQLRPDGPATYTWQAPQGSWRLQGQRVSPAADSGLEDAVLEHNHLSIASR